MTCRCWAVNWCRVSMTAPVSTAPVCSTMTSLALTVSVSWWMFYRETQSPQTSTIAPARGVIPSPYSCLGKSGGISVASGKGASICERSVLSFVIWVLILHTKRTFHSAIWSVNDGHFINYGRIFVFSRIGVVYKSNYNLKTNRQNWINILLG